MKKLGQAASVTAGVFVRAFQVAAHFNYIKIDYKKIEDDFNKKLDLNKDGKVDEKDVQVLVNKVPTLLQFPVL